LVGAAAFSIPAATVTIVDNDFRSGEITFSAPSYSVLESAGNIGITVLRTNGSTGFITVGYTTAPGTAQAGNDYLAQSGTLDFAEGVTSQVIVIPILDDSTVEGDETFSVILTNVSGGATFSGPTNVTVTILDEETGPGSLDRTFDPGLGADDFVRALAV